MRTGYPSVAVGHLTNTSKSCASSNCLLTHSGLILDCAEPGTRYRLMCLGLGSLSELQNARIQLVFLQLVLQNVLKVVSQQRSILAVSGKRLRGF